MLFLRLMMERVLFVERTEARSLQPWGPSLLRETPFIESTLSSIIDSFTFIAYRRTWNPRTLKLFDTRRRHTSDTVLFISGNRIAMLSSPHVCFCISSVFMD